MPRSSSATARACWANDILGTDLSFDLEIFVSPGGYICGEGSAQLEAIEGKRAEPRNKPPNSATARFVAETDGAE